MIILLALITFLAACSQQVQFSQEESREIANAHVQRMATYSMNDGHNLRLVSAARLACSSCYSFTYKFDIAPERIAGVASYQVEIPVIEGRIGNVTATEIPTTAYTIAEVTNESCKQDSDCKTPTQYLIRSNCPYTSACISDRCAVICPNVSGYSRAAGMLREHIENMTAFRRYNGRDLEISNIDVNDSSYTVDAQFTLQSEKNLSRAEHAKVRAFIVNWSITDVVYARGGPRILTAAECAAEGGKIVTECSAIQIGIVYASETPGGICCEENQSK
jgi:hypothetical protein